MLRQAVNQLSRLTILGSIVIGLFGHLAWADGNLSTSADRKVIEVKAQGAHRPEMKLKADVAGEVLQDIALITLSAEVKSIDQISSNKKLTAKLEELVKQAKKSKNIAVHIGDYRVWNNVRPEGKTSNWLGQAEIILESSDFPAVSALATALGDKAAITSIRFVLSRKLREQKERQLLNEAATVFRERAVAAATAFGFAGYRIVKLELGGGNFEEAGRAETPVALAQSVMSKGTIITSNVPLESNNETVHITVEGTIILQ